MDHAPRFRSPKALAWALACAVACSVALVQASHASASTPDGARERPGPALAAVLASLERHYPALLAAELSRQAAEHRVRAAQGRFDLNLGARGEHTVGGKYGASLLGVQASQRLPWGGLQWTAGYENGWDQPVYDAKRETSRWGEAFLSLKQPLLAGRSIDDARKDLGLAELDAAAAELERRAYRIELRLAAVRAYLAWVRAGAQHAIASRLVAIARERQSGVELQIQSGALPALEAVDNRRLIASRREKLTLAGQKLAQSALELGLYHRDARGRPAAPDLDAGMTEFPAELVEILERPPWPSASEISRRPDVLSYDNYLAKLRRKLAYADNLALPKLDAKAKLSQGFGDPRQYAPFASTQTETRATVGLELSLPVQRREALGESAALRSEVRALELQRQLASEKARLELESARQAVEAARQRRSFAEEARAAALALEEAERQRFADGLSNILTVNLREAASAAADSVVVEASYEYFLALASYRAAAAAL